MQVWVWAATAVGEWRRWNFIGSGSLVIRRLFCTLTHLDGVSTIPENPARSCSSACSCPCLP
ncbi:hypothetical protein BV20DRAFT_962263, partial [Pilatotrama ljubarskyi]